MVFGATKSSLFTKPVPLAALSLSFLRKGRGYRFDRGYNFFAVSLQELPTKNLRQSNFLVPVQGEFFFQNNCPH